MPMLQDSLDLDTLDAHGQLLGYYSDGPNPGDTLNTLTSYRTGLTSFPQISIDAADNIYVIYSGVTWQNPNPEGINYRHIFARAKFHDDTDWSTDPIDLNEGIIYYGMEYAFASMAKNLQGDMLRFIYQTSDQPGTAVGTSGDIPYHDNTIQYREIPGSTFWPTGTGNSLTSEENMVTQNYPNPASDLTFFKVNMSRAGQVTVEVANIMGQRIMTFDKGYLGSGSHRMVLDAGSLSSGIYFYTVRIDGKAYTHKMIVE